MTTSELHWSVDAQAVDHDARSFVWYDHHCAVVVLKIAMVSKYLRSIQSDCRGLTLGV